VRMPVVLVGIIMMESIVCLIAKIPNPFIQN
jgi:hypothetical protein